MLVVTDHSVKQDDVLILLDGLTGVYFPFKSMFEITASLIVYSSYLKILVVR